MSKEVKFENKLFIYFGIGCMGVVGMLLAYILTCLIMGPYHGPYELSLTDLCSIVFLGFGWSFFCGYIAYNFISKRIEINAKKPKDVRIKENKSVFAMAYIIVTVSIIVAMIVFASAIVNDLDEVISFSSGFIVALLIWFIGIQIGRKLIDKEEERIEKSATKKETKKDK